MAASSALVLTMVTLSCSSCHRLCVLFVCRPPTPLPPPPSPSPPSVDYYKEGLQHRVTKDAYRQSRARSFVFWVQTDAALDKWPITDDKINEFKAAFMKRR